MTKEQVKEYTFKITQANRVELIVIMYDIAIQYIDDAIACHKKNMTDEFRYNLKRAKNVVTELAAALDLKYEISGELMKLYMFMNKALIQCDIRNEAEVLERLTGMLGNLKESFGSIKEAESDGPVMENSQQVYAGLTYSKNSLNEDMYVDTNRGYTV